MAALGQVLIALALILARAALQAGLKSWARFLAHFGRQAAFFQSASLVVGRLFFKLVQELTSMQLNILRCV